MRYEKVLWCDLVSGIFSLLTKKNGILQTKPKKIFNCVNFLNLNLNKIFQIDLKEIMCNKN